ncbi:MAG: EcsC family protein [Clostridia bacterium]|nr:EcsC family protein [Clostridia bacterium]
MKKAEARLAKKASQSGAFPIDKIQSKIPRKVSTMLQKAFHKAFCMIFEHGVGVIEKSYDKDSITADFDIRNYAVDKKGSRRELKRLRRRAEKTDFLNMSIATAEGMGLGVLGIGFPDVVILTGMILKGIYELSLSYGYKYDFAEERYFILSLIKTALSKGEDWKNFNTEVDEMITSPFAVSDDVLKSRIEEASGAFATDMLILKFVQGIPLIGVVGGAFNGVYYNKIMAYARLKYHKRYLLDKQKEGAER